MRFLSSEESERIRKLHIARQKQLKQLLKKQNEEEQPAANAGAGWGFAPVDSVGADGLSRRSFEVYRYLSKACRTEDWQVSCLNDKRILQHLMLLDHGRLRRSAVLLFHSDPGSIFPGFGVTLIQSRKDTALLATSTLTGSINTIIWYLRGVDYTAYKERRYTYCNDISTWVRRACLNALVNNNYAAGRSIEVFIGDDEISVRSSCILPDGWTPERLLRSWLDAPFNPEIALAFCAVGFYCPGYDLLEEQKFGVPKCTVQGDVLTVSLEIFRDFMPKDYRGYDEYDKDAEDDDDDDYDEEDD